MADDSDEIAIIDVQKIIPQERHSTIFQVFHELEIGGAFLLVNDHDPRPLHYQFSMNFPGEFNWVYEQEGPDIWKVRISRA